MAKRETTQLRVYRGRPAGHKKEQEAGLTYSVEVYIDEQRLQGMVMSAVLNKSKLCRDGALIVKAHLETRI